MNPASQPSELPISNLQSPASEPKSPLRLDRGPQIAEQSSDSGDLTGGGLGKPLGQGEVSSPAPSSSSPSASQPTTQNPQPATPASQTPLSSLPSPGAAAWDLVIRPKTGWFDLHLSDLWRYRDLTMLFVWRDFVAQYKQTILGPLWYLLQPLMTTGLFTIIFGRIAKLPTDGVPPMLFYMAGVTAWTYFAECLNRTSQTFISNAGIFGKVYFPRLTVPVSVVISNLIKFGIQFALFLGFVAYFGARGADIRPNAAIALVPVLLIMMAALGLGLGIIISSLTTKYRDLQILVGFGVQLAMYATPVIYPLSIFPNSSRWIILLNPMAPIIETFRYAFLGEGLFSFAYLGVSAGIIGVILFIGILLFNHVEKTFMDTV